MSVLIQSQTHQTHNTVLGLGGTRAWLEEQTLWPWGGDFWTSICSSTLHSPVFFTAHILQ